jgi:hypothetical protein
MSLEITSLLASTLENMVKKAVREALKSCCSRYEIDVEEECRRQGVSEMRVGIKAMPKRTEGKESKKGVVLPFNKGSVSESECQGLCYNKGLYTQCRVKRVEGDYCGTCISEGLKWGTVEERMKVGLYEYEGKCGRKPVAYLKVLEKLKISVEEAEKEAAKQGITIDEEHLKVCVGGKQSLVENKQKSKKVEKSNRGRPKKEAQAVEAEVVVDLFAQISARAVENEVEVEKEVEKEVEVINEVAVKSKKLSEEDRAAKKEALAAAKAAEKAEKDAKIAAEKAEKDAKIAAEKAEKDAKIAAEKAEKDAKIAAVKAEKDAKIAAVKAEKEAKIAAVKAEKEAKIAALKTEKIAEEKAAKEAKIEAVKAGKDAKAVTAKEEVKPTKVTVTRIQIEGIEYMKSSANILYDPTSKEEMGLWDPDTQTIKELPDDEEEEEEDYEDEV